MLAVTCPRCTKPRGLNELALISSMSDMAVKLLGFECEECDYMGVFDADELPQGGESEALPE